MPKGQYQDKANRMKMNRHKTMAMSPMSSGLGKTSMSKRMDGAGAPAPKSEVRKMYSLSKKMKMV